MKKNERFRKIEAFASKQNATTIAALAGYLKVSESTVRRDVEELEKRGLLTKQYGSIFWIRPREIEQDYFRYRQSENIEIKERLARVAASLVEDGDAVFFESGTTLYAAVKYILSQNVTVVTADIAIAAELAKMNNVSSVMLGGYIWRGSFVVTGEIAENTLNNMNFTKYFTSPGAIGSEGELMYYTIQTTNIRDRAMAKAKTVVVVCDSSKYSKIGFITNGNITNANILVTDTLPEHIKKILSKKTRVILPPDDNGDLT
jgi:DeoR/GlpR family transcriptional regulator of sugar metabolism